MKYILLLILFMSQCNQRNADDILVSIPLAGLQIVDTDLQDDQKCSELNVTSDEIKGIWKAVVDLLPQSYLEQYVSTFNIISDGPDEILAGVSPADETNAQWSFDIDIEDYRTYKDDEDFRHTLIHEFGHILTLNDTQVEPTDMKWQEGERYLTNEGLARSNSYIQAYIDQFWKGELLNEWDKIQRINNDNKKYDAILSLYESNKDQFWTDYAAESPEEDIAESWYYFVVNDVPKGGLVKEKKLVFFSQYEDLMELREGIRRRISLD